MHLQSRYTATMTELRDSNITNALTAMPRKLFVGQDQADSADLDRPLAIGYGQTISQPTTVKRMLKWLGPKPGDRILDIGSGSGWTTALLSYLVGPDGHVDAVEVIPQLVEFGRANCERAGAKDNVRFHEAGTEVGLPKKPAYDRILVSAGADEMPTRLFEQIKTGGKIVIPLKSSILEISNLGADEFDTTEHPGYVFVPLV